jgi:hypothetical protein
MKSKFTLVAAITFLLLQPAFSQVSFTLPASLCTGQSAVLSANTGTLSVQGYTWTATPLGPGIISPLSQSTTISFPFVGAHTVQLAVETSTGTVYADNFIIINTSPVIGISPVNPTVCPGKTLELVAHGAQSYSWNPGTALSATAGASVVVSPSFTTIYTVVGSNASCNSFATIKVNMGSYPTIKISANATFVCAGTPVILTASGASSYTWIPTGLTDPAIIVGPGVYTVFGTKGACTDSTSIGVGVLDCLGLNANDAGRPFDLFPNPFTNDLIIRSETIGISGVSVTDAFGKLLRSERFDLSPDKKVRLDLSDLQTGIYFVKIISCNGKDQIMKATKE